MDGGFALAQMVISTVVPDRLATMSWCCHAQHSCPNGDDLGVGLGGGGMLQRNGVGQSPSGGGSGKGGGGSRPRGSRQSTGRTGAAERSVAAKAGREKPAHCRRDAAGQAIPRAEGPLSKKCRLPP